METCRARQGKENNEKNGGMRYYLALITDRWTDGPIRDVLDGPIKPQLIQKDSFWRAPVDKRVSIAHLDASPC